MSFSVHVPMWFGLLKIKDRKRLRKYEKQGQVPVLRVWNVCFVWIAATGKNTSDHPPAGTYYMKEGVARAHDLDDATSERRVSQLRNHHHREHRRRPSEPPAARPSA